MLHVVPPVFQPITLRSKFVYRDVSKRRLSPSEKTFLASEALEKTTMLTLEDTKKLVSQRLCNRYNLPFNSLKSWGAKVSRGQEITNKMGRPQSLDPIAVAAFVATLKA